MSRRYHTMLSLWWIWKLASHWECMFQAWLTVHLLFLRSLVKYDGVVRACIDLKSSHIYLFSFINVYSTNLGKSWAGYCPCSKWCPPKLLRRVQAFQQVVSTEVSVCGCSSASVCINIGHHVWPIESMLTSKFTRQTCGKWRIHTFFLRETYSQVTRYIIRRSIRQHGRPNMIVYYRMTNCLRLLGGVAGFTIHFFFLPLGMTSTGWRCVFTSKCMNKNHFSLFFSTALDNSGGGIGKFLLMIHTYHWGPY